MTMRFIDLDTNDLEYDQIRLNFEMFDHVEMSFKWVGESLDACEWLYHDVGVSGFTMHSEATKYEGVIKCTAVKTNNSK